MQHYSEILAELPTRERFLVLRLSRRQCRDTYCIALGLLRFAPSAWQHYSYLPRPWPSWWRRYGHPDIDMVRLGRPAWTSCAATLPLWSARLPATSHTYG